MYIALVDCICMEDVWHANLTCRGHPHVPGNIYSLEYICRYIALVVDCICMEDVWHANLTCRGHPHVPGNISSLMLISVLMM